MTNPEGRPSDRDLALERLLDLARQATAGGPTAAEQVGGLGRFEHAVAERELRGLRPRLGWRLGLGGALAGAAALGLTLWAGVIGDGRSALTFDVVGGASGDGGYVRAGNAETTELRFSDGTNMVLSPG